MADAPKASPDLPVEDQRESASMAFLSNALAIVGFIILFVIIVWGLFHIINLSGTSITSLFATKPAVTITAPKTAVTGAPVNISWKYSGSEGGSYSFLYQCDQNFYFGASASAASATLPRIPCGTAINVGSSTSATIVPVLSDTAVVNIPVTITFNPTTGAKSQASATIAITPATTTANTVKPPVVTTKPAAKPAYSYSPARRAVNLVAHAASGPADLSARMILVGVIDPVSGALLPRKPISPNEVIGVEFDVANIGGTASGSWYFTATLPTGAQPYLYTSPAQISLKPGEHIVSVMRFAPNQFGGIATITVDPLSRVYDANRSNNVVSQTI